MWLALAASSALALTTHLSAAGFDLTAGVGVAGAPLRPTGGGVLALGFFRGQFDADLSFGRYWWIGPTGRVDVGAEGVRVMPTLEVRRGVDLLVAGASYGLTAGPLFAGDALGFTGRAVGVGRFRRSRTVSLTARLELGVDYVDRPTFGGGFTVGASWFRPLRRPPSAPG